MLPACMVVAHAHAGTHTWELGSTFTLTCTPYRHETWDMFDHGFVNYMKHAFPQVREFILHTVLPVPVAILFHSPACPKLLIS